MAEFLNPFNVVIPEKFLSDREVQRAIRQSIAAEEEAVHLYEAIADATDNDLVKAVMQDIADEEKVHAGEFQELLQRLAGDEEHWLNEGAEEVEEISRRVAHEIVKIARMIVEGDTDVS
jgi:rubrerythrin